MPLVEGQRCYCTLVSDIENHSVVGLHTIMEPSDLRKRQGGITLCQHQVTPLRIQGLIMDIQVIATGVGKLHRAFKRTINIREIGRICKGIGFLQRRKPLCLCRQTTKRQQHQDQAQHTFRQSEEETGSLSQLTGSGDAADREDLTDLTVLLDDTLAVQQAEAMTLHNLVIKEMCKLFFSHTVTGIFHRYLHILFSLRGRHLHLSTFLRKLPGIVGKGIQHKERQHSVCLYHRFSRFYLQIHTLHLEPSLASADDIKQLLQRETLNLQTQFTLTQLDPIGQHIVIGIDLICQFLDIGDIGLTRMTGLIEDTVYKGCNGINQRHLCPLFQISSLTILHPQLTGSQQFFLLFKQIIRHILMIMFAVHVVEEP